MRTKNTAICTGMALELVPSPSQMNNFSETEKKIIANLVTKSINFLVEYIESNSNPAGTNEIFGGLSMGPYSTAMRLIDESISQITEILRKSCWNFSAYRVNGTASYSYNFCIKSNNTIELEKTLAYAYKLKRTRFWTTASLLSVNFALLTALLLQSK